MKLRQLASTFALSFLVATCALPVDELEDADVAEPSPQPVVRSPIDPITPIEVGVAPDGASLAQLQGLWWVNTFRMRAGLGPIDELQTLNTAAAAHAKYVLWNPDVYEELGLSVHEELEGHEGFFARRFWERMELAGYPGQAFREVIAYQAQPSAAVAHWIETVYHRLPILHPSAKHVGYAEVHLGASRINVLDIGSGEGQKPYVPGGIAWPPNGATNIPASWDGLESPQPPPPPGGYPSGPVVSLTFADGTPIEVVEHHLRRVDTDELIEHVLLTPDNDPNLQAESSVALYAHQPLALGITHEVTLRGKAGDVVFDRSWTFTTRSTSGCSLIAQDCGVGKACYGSTDDSAVCAWAGARREGSACDYQNDCDAGLTCVSSVCRRYCRIGPGTSGSCQDGCENGWTPVSNASALGTCSLE